MGCRGKLPVHCPRDGPGRCGRKGVGGPCLCSWQRARGLDGKDQCWPLPKAVEMVGRARLLRTRGGGAAAGAGGPPGPFSPRTNPGLGVRASLHLPGPDWRGLSCPHSEALERDKGERGSQGDALCEGRYWGIPGRAVRAPDVCGGPATPGKAPWIWGIESSCVALPGAVQSLYSTAALPAHLAPAPPACPSPGSMGWEQPKPARACPGTPRISSPPLTHARCSPPPVLHLHLLLRGASPAPSAPRPHFSHLAVHPPAGGTSLSDAPSTRFAFCDPF